RARGERGPQRPVPGARASSRPARPLPDPRLPCRGRPVMAPGAGGVPALRRPRRRRVRPDPWPTGASRRGHAARPGQPRRARAGALLLPGDLTRADALVLEGRIAARMIGAVVTLLALAGTIEGLLSASDAPGALKYGVCAATVAFLGLYLWSGWRYLQQSGEPGYPGGRPAWPARARET